MYMSVVAFVVQTLHHITQDLGYMWPGKKKIHFNCFLARTERAR